MHIINWPTSQIPKCTCSISHNALFKAEMCTFLFWIVHCGIWNRCILGFVKLVISDESAPQHGTSHVHTAWYTSGLDPLIYSRVYLVPCIYWFSSNTTCFIFYAPLGPRCPNKLLNWIGLNSPVYSGRDLNRPIFMPVRRMWRINENMTWACFRITHPLWGESTIHEATKLYCFLSC